MTETEGGLGALLEALPCAALVFSAGWRLQACNTAASRLLRETASALMGRALAELLPDCTPEQMTRTEGAWRPLRLQPSQGDAMPCLLRMARVDPDGAFLGLIFCEDGKEEMCRGAAESFYRRVFSRAGIGMALLDPTGGHILECNARFAEMLRLTPGELPGRRLTQLLHGDDQTANDVMLAGLSKGVREHYTLECLAYRRDRTLLALRLGVSLIRDALGKASCSLVLAEDITQQRHEEARLQVTEGRFRRLFEHNVAGMFRTTLDGRVIECNEAMARMLGFGYPAQLLLHHAAAFYPDPQHRLDFLNELREMVRVRSFEIELRRRDQTTLWGLISATLAPDADGNLTIVDGSIVDITERKLANDLLRRQRDLARELAGASSLDEVLALCLGAALDASGLDCGGIYLSTPEGGMELALARGFSEPFLNAVATLHPHDPRMVFIRQGMPLYLRTGDPLAARDAALRAEGLRALAAMPIKWQDQVIGCFSLASHTLDEVPAQARVALETIANEFGSAISRVRAEATVRQREAELATLFESLRDLVIVLDSDGRLLSANRSACRSLGYAPEELVGRHLSVLHPPEMASEANAIVAALRQGGGTTSFLPLLARDGTVTPVETTFSLGNWGSRQVHFGVSRDLSERQRHERQILELSKRQAVGRLAAGVAHEFNNLLQAMLGHATLLRLRAGDATAGERLASELELQIRRGALVARQLLEFSHPGNAEWEPVELGEVLRQALDTLSQLVRGHIVFEVALHPEPLVVEGDRSLLELVVWNLVVNAVEAMPGGGELSVSSGRDAEVWFAIADTGSGIPSELHGRIFEPLFTTKQASDTSGLGLSVVADIVARHGGRIQVESEPGEGSRFRVAFPPSSRAVAAPPPRPTGRVTGPRQNVLLVEDDDQSRGSLARLLQALDCSVWAAGSAEEALTLRPSGFDLLITDLLLPGLSGDELAALWMKEKPDLRVLLISGFGLTPELRRRAAGLGVRILPKPFGIDTLAREIALVRRSSPRPPA